MKDIREVYPDVNEGYFCVGNYTPLLESFGYEIVEHGSDNDYQGDDYLLFRDGDRYGLLVFGWGSCSGCDALQACNSYEDIDGLRASLHDQIKWDSAASLLTYMEGKDWELEWYGREEAFQWFLPRALDALRSATITTPAL